MIGRWERWSLFQKLHSLVVRKDARGREVRKVSTVHWYHQLEALSFALLIIPFRSL